MIWVGTSGYNYPEWKGHFYPATLPAAKMLPYYAERFPTVEINYTFYRAPEREDPRRLEQGDAGALQADAEGAEADHARCAAARLRGPRAPVPRDGGDARAQAGRPAVSAAAQPEKDLALFDAFLDAFPPRVCAAFEFRHASWFDEEVYARLRARNLALCIADSEKLSTPVVITADYGYFRLRDEGYMPADIARWGDVITEQASAWRDVFVYFKHEEEGKGPEFARTLMRALGLAGESAPG